MRILVYPHDLGMGGSQLNAIELAGAVRDLGHDVLVYGRPGVLNALVAEKGLEFVESPAPGRRPSLGVARHLAHVVRVRGVDVVHGYEWPPILEGRLAVLGSTAAVTGTVMSMAVAPFVPRDLPLVVGTRQIADHEERSGRRQVVVIEPPVDVAANAPAAVPDFGDFERSFGIPRGTRTVVVSRLAQELKLEGLLTAIDVVPTLAEDAVLVVVGDGPARRMVDEAAIRANARAGRRAVVVTGEVADPRPAYALADVTLGMGGSALRSMAFGKPLVVQGERGFWSTLTPETLSDFSWTGWYGVGTDSRTGPDRLRAELSPLLADAGRRRELGAFSRRTVVDRFSLSAATARQMAVYDVAARGVKRSRLGVDDLRAARDLLSYKAARLTGRLRGQHRTDDFNARPVALASRESAPTAPFVAPAEMRR